MEFWLGLSKNEIKRRLARQRRLRSGFFALGVIFLAIQGMIAIQGAPSSAQEALATAGLLAQEPGRSPAIQEISTLGTPVSSMAGEEPGRSPAIQEIPTLGTPGSNMAAEEPGRSPAVPETATPSPTPVTSEVTGRAAPSPTPRSGQTPARAASLALISPPRTVSEQQFRLQGTGRPGSEVTIHYVHSVLARAEVDPAGRWQADVPTAPMARGENRLRISGGGSALALDLTFNPWWLDAPLRFQGTLGDGFACAPTVLGMALDYYHQHDPDLPAPATNDLVRALRGQGFIDGYGADAEMLVNLAINYGYSHSYFYREWTQAHLRQALDAGTPVVANVRAEMSTDGYGHSVLVVGLSPDGRRVMVHDPAQGRVEYAWTAFDRSWGSFGPPYRHGMVVKP